MDRSSFSVVLCYLAAAACCLPAGCSPLRSKGQNRETFVSIEKQPPVFTTADSLQWREAQLRKKYSGLLQSPPDSIHNLKLYGFIDEWLHTPYKWGGNDKTGIDCSAFMQRLFGQVYAISIPRTSADNFSPNR
ncbi:MAG: NlpC/P60 family protein [Flavihumibacter sp.]